MDGCGSDENERVLTIGATNRPQELDDAARRRFVKKLFIPLPEKSGRKEIIQKLMLKASNNVTDEEIDEIAEMTDGSKDFIMIL
jgi:SpoVK/Ycf46/Vps4 family AAA+-type ATPase